MPETSAASATTPPAAAPRPPTAPGNRETAAGPPARDRPPRPAATLAVVSAATLLALMTYTAPLAVLPDTVRHLHSGPTGPAWILSSISLGLSATQLTAGSLADALGRRRVFVAGAVGLAAASALTALAGSLAVFVVGRILQGVAGSALLAAGLGLVGHAFPTGPARVRATALVGATFGAGVAVGPLATAELTRVAGYASPYWAHAAAALLLAVAATVMPESRAAVRRGLDPLGALTLGGGIGTLTAALVEGRQGWGRPTVAVLLGSAALLLTGYAATALRGRDPMVDPRLLRNPVFRVSILGSLITGVGVIAVASYLPTLFQGLLDLTPLQAAALLAFWSGASVVVSLAAGRVSARVSARRQLALGLGVIGAGFLGLLTLSPGSSWGVVVPGLLVAGVGLGLLNAATTRLAVESVPPDRAGMGAGASNTARYTGSSLGGALVVAVVQSAPGGTPVDALAAGGERVLALGAALSLLGALAAVLVRDRAPRAHGGTRRTV
ncbi:MFS transporter [Yinghuangia sp. ASG 101]|uniref:MFS transporter n=1 Tax=Yinghuangia sp. ASG 101 TaxID=2896848 RepID=UPI001E33CF05|nr:MFS transporter [Yinghuangia sp. ASG 101]UGQ13899.1 MFS transporter [Yinghuangia sp. ASG 101]